MPTYEAYAVNLNHTPRPGAEPVDETTRYTNFPFDYVMRRAGNYYGVNRTGIFLLAGETDNGALIPWGFKTALTDFKTPLKKTVVSAYLGGRLGPAATLQLQVGEASTQTHSYSTPRGADAQNYRQSFGLGNKARYYALGASGTGALELDNIEFNTHTLTRRI